MNVTVLVDFENDSVRTALEVARRARRPALGRPARHVGVARRPLALSSELGDFKPTGVNERLVWKVRERARRSAATSACASSSRAASPPRRSASSRQKACPVDAYGVGSSLIRGSNDFTGDIVITDGEPSAKVGRRYRENPRLELVT